MKNHKLKELANVWTNRRMAQRVIRALAAEGIEARLLDYATAIHTPRFRYGIAVPGNRYGDAVEIADSTHAD